MRYDKSVYVLISVLSSEHTILKAEILNDGIKIYKKLVLCYIEMSYTRDTSFSHHKWNIMVH